MIVLDLETLGTTPGSVVATIGAAKIDGCRIVDRFYERISIPSSLAAGLTTDAATLAWWRNQSVAAQEQIFSESLERSDLDVVLGLFEDFAYGDREIYGNGPAFDCSILAAAYRAVGRSVPWHYRTERCLRTERHAVERAGREWKRVKPWIPHHALLDAEAEAKELIVNVLSPLRKKGGKKG